MSALQKELETYLENLPNLLPEEGKFILIHNGDAAGTFYTCSDALSEGYKVREDRSDNWFPFLFRLSQVFTKPVKAPTDNAERTQPATI